MAAVSSSAGTSARLGRPSKVAITDIVDAALEMYGTHGLHGTSLAAIAERVGLTDAGLLHHFPSKSALLDAALTRSADLQVDRMRALVAAGGLEAIRRMATWGAIVRETPELTAFQVLVSADAVRTGSPVREWAQRRYAAVNDLVAGLIREGIERGDIRPDVDPEQEASGLVAFLDGIRLPWLYSDGRLDIAAVVERHFDALVARIAVTG